jgi:high-affinity K+ transport system ATPase subunit B
MIALVEGAKRQKTPNEIALNILLASLTIIFMLAVISLQPMAFYSKAPQTLVILVALLVALIPTTIGALLSAIGIAGMDRLVQHNVLAMSGRAVEAAGDVSTLLLDKTGTITIGNREATELLPVGGVTVAELARATSLSSATDETPEGRSIVRLALALSGAATAPNASPTACALVSQPSVTQVPVDAVTSSGSGLGPDISVDYALLQAQRVATVRNLPLDQVQQFVKRQINDRQFGVLGERRVNVLDLNLALDELGGGK